MTRATLNRWGKLALAMIAAALLLPRPVAAAPAALDQAPADAQVVVVIPSLSALSTKIAQLNQQLGIQEATLDDALGNFKALTGMVNGVNDDGPMLLVLPDVAGAIRDEQAPAFAILVPVADYAAFVGNFGGQGDGVTQLMMPDGQPGFARQLGQHAVLSNERQTVEAYQAGGARRAIATAAGQAGDSVLDRSAVSVFVNVAAIGPALQPVLQESVAEMQGMFDFMMDPQQAAQAKAMYQLYANAVSALLRDSSALVLGADFTEAGLSLSQVAQLKADSATASYFPGNASPSPLAKLPPQPYLMAGTFDTRAIDLSKLMTQFLAAMPEQAGPMTELYQQSLPVMKLMKTSGWAWYAPNQLNLMGPGLLNFVTVYETDNGADFVQANRRYIESMNNMAVDMGDPQMGQMTFTTQYTPGALEIDGAKVDQYGMQFVFPPQMMQEMGPMAPLMMMMGGTGYNGYIAQKGHDVLVTTAMDPQIVQATLNAIDRGQGLGRQAALADVRQALPDKPAMEVYIGIESILNTVNQFLALQGGQPLAVEPNLPPLAMGLSVEDNALAGRFVLPTPTLKALGQIGAMIQGMFGGGDFDFDDDDDFMAPAPF